MPEDAIRLKLLKDAGGCYRLVGQLKDVQFDDEKGTVRAVFTTLNVIDHQGDMMLSGSIGEQRVRMSTWQHGSWGGGLNNLPVGKGRVFEAGGVGVFEGRFFLDTTAGLEVYKTVKNLGDLQEWSFALPDMQTEMRTTEDGVNYRAIKAVSIPEVSPVLLGAGIDTRTLDIKAQGAGAPEMKLVDELECLLAQAQKASARLQSVASLREKEDRAPSSVTMKRAVAVSAGLSDVVRVLDDVRTRADGLKREFVRFQQFVAGRV